ncbi:MAG: hypothetical protein WC725_01410 [Patescibacteria group bacterium]|jgi:hypothetical protein
MSKSKQNENHPQSQVIAAMMAFIQQLDLVQRQHFRYLIRNIGICEIWLLSQMKPNNIAKEMLRFTPASSQLKLHLTRDQKRSYQKFIKALQKFVE